MTWQCDWLNKRPRSDNRGARSEATDFSIFSATTLPAMAILLWIALGGIPRDAAWSLEVDSTLDEDIRFQPQPEVKQFSEKLKPLWVEALKHPEIELKRQAAYAIARAHREGMQGLQETAEVLLNVLRDESVHPIIELAVVQALIELDARESAPLLMDCVHSSNLELTAIIEPVLAQWDHKPMRAVWHKRLASKRTPRPLLVLAIEGLATAGDVTAAEALKKMAIDVKTPPDLRLKTARATGRLQQESLEKTVQSLLGDGTSTSVLDRLVAVLLLRHHSGTVTQERLLSLAVDPEGAVGALALERLKELDTSLVTDINDRLAASPDARVRKLVAECLLGQATVDSVALLGVLLDDPIPEIRIFAGDALAQLFNDARLRDSVRKTAVHMLDSDRPLGLEQAALVVGQIDHEPAWNRLLELLTHAEPKVNIAAAWALRRVEVLETGTPMFDFVQRQTVETRTLDDKLWETWNQLPPPVIDFEGLRALYTVMEHLTQALASLRYKEADLFLRRYLPTPPLRNLGDPPAVAAEFQTRLRATVIGTLGHLYEDEPPPKELKDRVLGILSGAPDPPSVRAAAAIALARMKAVDAIPVLRSQRGDLPPHKMVGAACCRALERLVGEPFPPAILRHTYRVGWFLESFNEED